MKEGVEFYLRVRLQVDPDDVYDDESYFEAIEEVLLGDNFMAKGHASFEGVRRIQVTLVPRERAQQ